MITIREMQFDDLDQIIPIEKANFSDPWTANGFFSFLIREDARFLTAVEDEKVIGYCGAILIPPESEITNVCVTREYRRMGVAKLLLERLKQDLAALCISTIHLEVRQSNLAARALYEHLGFVQDGLRPCYYENPTEDAVLMSLNF